MIIRTVFVYLVLFSTLMMMVGGGIGIFMASADLISPQVFYQSYDDYKNMSKQSPDGKTDAPKKNEQEMRKSYNDMVKDSKERARRSAENALIRSFGWVLIPLPVFFYFNRMRKKLES